MGDGVGGWGGNVVGNGVMVVCGGGGWEIKKLIVLYQTWTLHQSSIVARFSVVNLDKSLVYIDQLYNFMKIFNLSRVGIPTQT